MPIVDHKCKSEIEAKELVHGLGPGWQVVPADCPETGERGVYVFQDPPNPQVEDQFYRWPLFGEAPLEPDIQHVAVQAFIEFAKEEPEATLFTCDEPKRLYLGLISYRLASEGKSVVRLCPLTEFQTLPDEDRYWYGGYRERLKDKWAQLNDQFLGSWARKIEG